MPLLGAHMSIAGGLENALLRGKKRGCSAIQIFTRNSNRWDVKPLEKDETGRFQRARKETGVEPVAVHDSYLINLASPRQEVRDRSLKAFLEEIKRTEALNIPYLVMHPGAHLGEGEKAGIKRVSDAFDLILERCGKTTVTMLLETTAGQGSSLGYRFEHIAGIIERVRKKERFGVCLDTCHIFAAGYDFRTPRKYGDLIGSFDETIGLDRLRLFHFNDSKKDPGSRVDRHEHLGRGKIGKAGLSFFLKDPRFRDIPFVLETPKGADPNGDDWDEVNLKFMREILEE